MTDEAKEALEDVTRAVADASRVTTPAERLKHLLELVLAEVSVLDEQANPVVRECRRVAKASAEAFATVC